MLTVGSLFSGIGGLDLGLERAGMRVIWQSEIDSYASKILKKHWPQVVNHGDIKQINWDNIERPDVICGGYPCQPFSLAGKRNGTDDPRHLFPWVLTAISRLRPKYAILENVRGHLSMGGVEVIGCLTSIGYDAEWRVVSAASIGANHRRDRLIIVAHTDNPGGGTSEHGTNGNGQTQIEERRNLTLSGASRLGANVADPNGEWLGVGGASQSSVQNGIFRVDNRIRQATNERRQWWETEPDVGRVAYGIPSRVDRLRALGNAVVPQVAQFIGEMVVAHHAQTVLD